MQTTTQKFIDNSKADLRPLSWGVKMAFSKQYNASIGLFTIGASLIGGNDLIAPASSSVIQEWDKYVYTDFSERIVSMEWTREVELFASVTLAMADIVLDNHDDYFTPGGTSPISSYILPYRPIRLYAGFDGEVIPVFIGLTEKMPVVDQKTKTVRFHCIDFMYSLFNRPLDEAVMYQDEQIDTILSSLFVLAGLSSAQLNLDSALTTIPFVFFDKGTRFLDALKTLMQVEQGRIYMDENGVICFKNRQNYSSTSVYSFDAYKNINDIKTRTQDDIINVVQINSNLREVQPKQKYWESPNYITVPANSSIDIWADFVDPVTAVDTPIYTTSATSSSFTVNTASDGSGSPDASSVTLTDHSLFAKSYKMTFTNSSGSALYITILSLFATPAVTTKKIYVREVDDDSVAAYDERILEINNNFFPSESEAQGKALGILRDYSSFGGYSQLDVKGVPSLQLDDTIYLDIFNRVGNYKITRITNKYSLGKYTQLLDVRRFTPTTYFTIGVSLIGGTDELQP